MNRTDAYLKASTQDASDHRKKSILIVDNEEDLIWSISKTLTRADEKLEVTCVQDGDSALEVLARKPVDVVVSDVRMPGRDGLQLLEEINCHYPQTKVIIMTAYGSEDMQNHIHARTPYYLEKPFEIQYLKRLIYTALLASPSPRNHLYDSPLNFSKNAYSFTYFPLISSLAMLAK